MPKVARCTTHCRSCERCFHSTRGFDSHRAGDHQAGTRYCLDPAHALDKRGDPVFVAATTRGICKLRRDGIPRHDVTIWVLLAGLSVAERFERKRAAEAAAASQERPALYVVPDPLPEAETPPGQEVA